MPILDFKEIPEAHIASGKQDTFELFCQEFLKYIGLEIDSYPDRGPDGGKDLICLEKIQGTLARKEIKWLVSCKHKAHSNSAVGVNDEVNITDRVSDYDADGFIAFYSTVPSSKLNDRFNLCKKKFDIKVFNPEEIEDILLKDKNGHTIIQRFFPESYKKIQKKVKPSNIYSSYEPLNCHCCGKDLLKENNNSIGGIIAFVVDYEFSKSNGYMKNKYVDVYFACKGRCDSILSNKYSKQGFGTYWKDISELKTPTLYIRWVIAIINNIYEGSIEIDDVAFKRLKHVILTVAQIVFRHQSESEIKRSESILELPEWI